MGHVGVWCDIPLLQLAQLQVEQMAKQLGVADNVSYTCETAAHFWLLHVLAPWEKFMAAVQARRTPDCVKVCLGSEPHSIVAAAVAHLVFLRWPASNEQTPMALYLVSARYDVWQSHALHWAGETIVGDIGI